ncbi:MAG: hypothetical protein DMD48_08725 [Gemmatimonadetes bacterium]|nr:MAG: hypothetical protein DMD48_08725 [Gemmatimonadota bacterium]
MIQHIMVQAVLQQSVSGFYTDLVTRPTGRAVRENIERDLPPGTIAVMDFTGVGCLDSLEGLGASEPAPALLDELVERRLAARNPGGSIRLTAA